MSDEGRRRGPAPQVRISARERQLIFRSLQRQVEVLSQRRELPRDDDELRELRQLLERFQD